MLAARLHERDSLKTPLFKAQKSSEVFFVVLIRNGLMCNLSRIAMTCNYPFSALLLCNNGCVMWIERFQALRPSFPFGNWRKLRRAFKKHHIIAFPFLWLL
ncbi:hypothetical protein RCH09_002731 [Actimicrobium sp. GrIS 1.19]|nr:hypothetical protein [Actimicrobium sp. GrIS 1.19]